MGKFAYTRGYDAGVEGDDDCPYRGLSEGSRKLARDWVAGHADGNRVRLAKLDRQEIQDRASGRVNRLGVGRYVDKRLAEIDAESNWAALNKLSEQTGISIWTLYSRYKTGDRGDRLIRPASKFSFSDFPPSRRKELGRRGAVLQKQARETEEAVQ